MLIGFFFNRNSWCLSAGSIAITTDGNETNLKKSCENVTPCFLCSSTRSGLQLLLSHSRLPQVLRGSAGILSSVWLSCWTCSQQPRFVWDIPSGITHRNPYDCEACPAAWGRMQNKPSPSPSPASSTATAGCAVTAHGQHQEHWGSSPWLAWRNSGITLQNRRAFTPDLLNIPTAETSV